VRTILARRPWTAIQRKWIERIGKQLKAETIVDREALDQGAFKTDGGFVRIDKLFDGTLEQVLGDLHDAVWADAA
jgi:type I restriction enzyme R subunit